MSTRLRESSAKQRETNVVHKDLTATSSKASANGTGDPRKASATDGAFDTTAAVANEPRFGFTVLDISWLDSKDRLKSRTGCHTSRT